MRTTPAGLHSAALVAFDGKVRACLESIGCFPVSDRIWHQATLGVKHGGLGLRQCAVHATAAYLASVATTPEACRGLDGRYNPDWPTSSATAAAYNAVVLEADRFRGDQAHRQQALSAVLDKAQLAQLMVTAEDASGRAHLQLLQQPAAGAWLSARPSPALGLDLDPAFFGYCSVCGSVFLLQALMAIAIYCPLCNGIADRFGDHARACPCGGDRTKRHNGLRTVNPSTLARVFFWQGSQLHLVKRRVIWLAFCLLLLALLP